MQCSVGYDAASTEGIGRNFLLLSPGAIAEPWAPDPRSWEKFHARDNATARFYKERRCSLPPRTAQHA